MRTLLLVCLLAACEHRPAPQKQDTPPTIVTPDAAAPVTDASCEHIGANIADVIIRATTDAQQQAAYEQDRAKIIARFVEGCEGQVWPAATRACFSAAKTPMDVEGCSRALAAVHDSGSAR
ncbi:MAG TPA: hypothetical protein VK427_18990 [Kofleriaceae bacterium]|nr:hypothetical protein [Kofleriaceae bacterium]